MPRFKTSRSHSKKARSRTDSRAPGGSRSHQPRFASEVISPKAKYAARARHKAHERAEYGNREPTVDPHMVALAAMEKYGFEADFSLVVNAKANGLDESTVERAGAGVRDLRSLLWSSIGNVDSEDLDCIEYCERGQGGEILVKVAITDLDAYVPKGSILDERAQINATAVHTSIESFPMLPERVSKDLSSLAMNHDRLAVVVEFAVLPRGNIRHGKIYRAIVRNRAQLAYEEVSEWLDGQERQSRRDGADGASAEAAEDNESVPEMMDETQGLREQIRLQDEASVRLGKYRSGQVAYEKQDAAKDGKALWLYVADSDRAKRIIENFTMAAADSMDGFLDRANVPSVRRVVGIPKSWDAIVDIAFAKGFKMPLLPDALTLSEFLEKEKKANPEKFPALSLEIAKLLGPGEYAVFDRASQTDYFCLAVAGNIPGMAPNQRYMDLVIQRLVKAAAAHVPSRYSMGELDALAELCTEREDAAKKVEKSLKYVKV